ncbi:MFS transporter [Sphingobium sp. EP60837]|uniref:MFS transporter n=1 Tax=Sphingobium sp. EP60837 TaxID=1855519 RepID=UPI00082A3806
MPLAERPTRFRWVVLAIVAFGYFLASADRANLSVALPYLKSDFGLSNAEAGAAASVFLFGIAVIQIPGSLLIQRLRVRAVMVLAIMLTSAATVFTGMVSSGTQLLAARLLLGVAEGPIPVGSLTTLNRWFPPRERATAVGIYVASFKFAPTLVPPIAAFIIIWLGWREVFYFFGIVGLLAGGLWMFVADSPDQSKKVNQAELLHIDQEAVKADSGERSSWDYRPVLDFLIRARRCAKLQSNLEALRSMHIWGCALAYCLMSGLSYAILTWVPTYLVEVKKYNLMTVGYVAAAPWLGAVFGSIIGGLLSDRVFGGRRKPVMLITAGSSIATMYALVSAPNSPAMLAILLLATGFLLTVGYSTFTIFPMGVVKKEVVPFAVSIVSTVGSIGGGTAPVIVGYILDHSGWSMAFGFLSSCSILAFILVASIIEPLSDDAPAHDVP